MADMYFVLRCMGHKKRTLRRGDRLTIGRDATNDMVLQDGTVSRHHVEINWDADQAFPLIGVKSSSGVEIEGEVQEDDLFLTDDLALGLGDSTVIFQLKGKRPNEKPTAHLHRIEEPTVVRLFSESTTRIKGEFTSPAGLIKALVGLEAKKRTGTLKIDSGGRTGKVIFGQGRLITARWCDLPALTALNELIELESGGYLFSADLEPCEDNLDLSVVEHLASIKP